MTGRTIYRRVLPYAGAHAALDGLTLIKLDVHRYRTREPGRVCRSGGGRAAKMIFLDAFLVALVA